MDSEGRARRAGVRARRQAGQDATVQRGASNLGTLSGLGGTLLRLESMPLNGGNRPAPGCGTIDRRKLPRLPVERPLRPGREILPLRAP